MKILVVDDEEKLTDALSYMIKKNNYSVDVANDGEYGYDLASTGIYDVIVLDIMLPGMDGITILKNLRKDGITTPIIMLTAKDAVHSRVEGLDSGADDYLVKPFSSEELFARIRALLRRKTEEIRTEEIILKDGKVVLDPSSCELTIGKKNIKLNLKETHILESLMINVNKTITRDQLLDKIWGFEKEVEMNNIETYICYLRKKIDFKSAGLKIQTIRGVGYCLKEI